MFYLDQLDDIFQYHKWSDAQVALGGQIRGIAKELARSVILSAPHRKGYPTEYALADECRERAIHFIRLAVQEANAAIIFDAATKRRYDESPKLNQQAEPYDLNEFIREKTEKDRY